MQSYLLINAHLELTFSLRTLTAPSLHYYWSSFSPLHASMSAMQRGMRVDRTPHFPRREDSVSFVHWPPSFPLASTLAQSYVPHETETIKRIEIRIARVCASVVNRDLILTFLLFSLSAPSSSESLLTSRLAYKTNQKHGNVKVDHYQSLESDNNTFL